MVINSTSFNEGSSILKSLKKGNGGIELQLNRSSNYINCISNIILKRNKKYVFRIQIDSISGNCFYVGLMKKSNSSLQHGYIDSLSCYLSNIQGAVCANFSNRGINKFIQCSNFFLSYQNTIELRVSQEDQILEVLDYPNYEYKVSLSNANKTDFMRQQDVVLYLSFWKKENLTLYLQDNKFGDKGISNIGIGLSNCTKIATLELYLSLFAITDVGAQAIGAGISKCTNLINLELFLTDNLVGVKGASGIEVILSKCSLIQRLQLYLSQTLFIYLTYLSICFLKKLFINHEIFIQKNIFKYSKNQIGDEGAATIGNGLSQCKNIIHLGFFLSQLRLIQIIRALQILYFYTLKRDNQIGDTGVSVIGQSLGNCELILTLRLFLRENKFGDDGAISISKGLSNCKNLSKLIICLRENSITDYGYLKLDDTLSNLSKLHFLECYFRHREKLLKSNNLLNCRNLKQLMIDLTSCYSNENILYHTYKAFKIKRLVVLEFKRQ
ncbi:hypothetical protein ABPG72_015005 [Tetrahymena utriculariae]